MIAARVARLLCLAALGASAGQTSGEDLPSVNRPGKEAFAPTACWKPLVSVHVREDVRGTLTSVRARLRELKLPSIGDVAERVVDQGTCLTLLEGRPGTATAPEPESAAPTLRVRVVDLQVQERTLAEKADSAIRRYVGAYLGEGDSPTELVLQGATVTVELVCPARKGVVRRWQAGDQGPLPARGVLGDDLTATLDANAERLTRAFARAHDDVVEYLRETPAPCSTAAVRTEVLDRP